MTCAQLRSERVKLRSLPSSYVVTAAVGLGLGISALEMAHSPPRTSLAPADRRARDPRGRLVLRLPVSELAFGALGVLTIGAEYTSGTIGPILLASPRRLQVYLAKVLVLGAVILRICLASAFAAFLTGQYAVRHRDLAVTLADRTRARAVLRAVLTAGVDLVVVTLLGLGLGAGIRHTGGALTLMVAVVFLAWPVARAVEGFTYLPDRWLLVNAADALVGTHPPTGPNSLRTPSFAMACVELATYLVVVLGLGAWRANRDP